jgi:hypothetical protein
VDHGAGRRVCRGVRELALPDPAACIEQTTVSAIGLQWRPVAEELDTRLGQAGVLLDLGQAQASLALADSAMASIDALPEASGLRRRRARASYVAGAVYWALMA